MATKFLSNEGLLYFWKKISTYLSNKVDKEDGKGLSSNDYTDAEKTKLASISTASTAYKASALLTAGGWSNNSQSVTVSGISADDVVIITPAPESINDYTAVGIVCTGQTTDMLTFTCSTVPTVDITFNMVIIGSIDTLPTYTAAEGAEF